MHVQGAGCKKTAQASSDCCDEISQGSGPVLEPVSVGQPIYVSELGFVGLAGSDSVPEACFRGFALESAGVGFAVTYQSDGVLTFPESTWDAITGDTGGLTPGALYHLAPAVGTMSKTPPSTGYFLVIGRALDSEKLVIEIDDPLPL